MARIHSQCRDCGQVVLVTNPRQHVHPGCTDTPTKLESGFGFVHGPAYSSTGFVQNAIQLPTSPGYAGATTCYMTLTQNLPLLDPLRDLPSPLNTYGNALADLLQPDLRVIVDMGYGSNEYANIPTPASLVEIPDPFTILPDLAKGVVQGIDAAAVDLHLLPHSMYPTTYPFMPELNPGLNFPLPQTSAPGMPH